MQYISVDTITKISSELPAIVNHLSQKAHAVVREEKKNSTFIERAKCLCDVGTIPFIILLFQG